MTENIEQIIADAIANGTPVKLRDGSKAFLKYDERKEPEVLSGSVEAGHNPIVGYRVSSAGIKIIVTGWTSSGSFLSYREHCLDIIGAWVEPRPTRIINGIEVPAPLSWDEFKPDRSGFMNVAYIEFGGIHNDLFASKTDKFGFLSGQFYKTRADAQANFDAYMKGLE